MKRNYSICANGNNRQQIYKNKPVINEVLRDESRQGQ